MYRIDILKKLFSKKININQYLRKKTDLSEKDIIKLSYDVQSGSYVKSNNYNYIKSKKILSPIIKEINSTNFKSLMDFGCGELTNFYTLLNNIKTKNKFFIVYDLSFSRILVGKKFLNKKKKFQNKNIHLKCFCNNTIKIPLPDNSIDIVTTCHSLESNKTNANKILKELWRISKKKLILMEPNNRLIKNYSNKDILEQKFKKHKYVLDLEKKIKKITLKYKIIDNKLNFDPTLPASIYILEKNSNKSNKFNFLNPKDDKDILKNKTNFYYSKKTGEIFPIIDGVVMFNKREIYTYPNYIEKF
jgi:ubiquinone/menaquinone biosynthesis C-methylase UbiE